jgi:hypothetical protein
MIEYFYKIRIPVWSATDYSFLVNSTSGHVSDDYKFYEFRDYQDFVKMKSYLGKDE